MILPYTLKTIWWTNVIIGKLVPCYAKIYLIFKCMWLSDLHFTVQWFYPISWRLFDGLMLYWKYWFSVMQTLTWNYYVGQWPIFHGPVILPYILKTIWWTNVITGILDPCDVKWKVTYISWSSDTVLYLEDFLVKESSTEYWFSATLS